MVNISARRPIELRLRKTGMGVVIIIVWPGPMNTETHQVANWKQWVKDKGYIGIPRIWE